MARNERWYFSKEALKNTPSRKCGIEEDKELSYRQQAANLIQDMGQRLEVNQLCINTAIVYMHRYFMFHAFNKTNRHSIPQCALFLAAKVEEQPRKLEHVIRIAHMLIYRDAKLLDLKSNTYEEKAHEIVKDENILLQTLGFDIGIEHPHTSVVEYCEMFRSGRALCQTSFFMATNSLHLTTMCLQHKPTMVACACIQLALKWSSIEFPKSAEGKDWYNYVDGSITLKQIEDLTSEFIEILNKCPSRLKRKIFNENSDDLKDVSNATKEKMFHPMSKVVNSTIDEKKVSPSKGDQKQKNISATKSTNDGASTSTSSTALLKGSPSSNKRIKREPDSVRLNQPLVNSVSPAPVTTSIHEKRVMKFSDYKATCSQQSKQSTVAAKERLSVPFPTGKESNNNSDLKQPEKPINVKAPPTQTASKTSQQLPTHSVKQEPLPEKVRTSDERSNPRQKSYENAWCENNTSNSNPSSQRSTANAIVSQVLCGTLDKPSSNFSDAFNNPSSGSSKVKWENSSEDSSDMKNNIVSDLKMEFSDNESNHSGNGGFNLSSFPSFSRESNSNTGVSETEQNTNKEGAKLSTSSNRSSFMSIFTNSNNVSPPPGEAVNSVKSIKMKPDRTETDVNRILEDMPVDPPPMISPLKSESVSPQRTVSKVPELRKNEENDQLQNSFQQNPVRIKVETKPSSPKTTLSKSPMPSVYSHKTPHLPMSPLVKAEVNHKQIVDEQNSNCSPIPESRQQHHNEDNEVTKHPQFSSPQEKNHRDKPHKHHKERKSHKEKHKKNKNKDKDREKVRHRDKHSEKHGNGKEMENSSHLTVTTMRVSDRNSTDTEVLNQQSPIKLKICKKNVSKKKTETSESENEKAVDHRPPPVVATGVGGAGPPSIKIVIPRERLSGVGQKPPAVSTNATPKKRKSSHLDSTPQKVPKIDRHANSSTDNQRRNSKSSSNTQPKMNSVEERASVGQVANNAHSSSSLKIHQHQANNVTAHGSSSHPTQRRHK